MSINIESAEELREVILSQHRQLETLRREVDDAELLIAALKGLLDVDGDVEPFATVFAVLTPVFAFSHALVLVEEPAGLRCVVASHDALVDSAWPRDRLLDKSLSGRVTATTARGDDVAWPAAARAAGLSPDQPALYLPLGFRDRRGLLVLLRPSGGDGFDRRDVAVARKLSVLASQAFATRLANGSERERQRLHELTVELRSAQAALAQRANHDPLTGLPNRACFEERIGEALRRAEDAEDRRLALAFIDLDGFKQVNDYYGHETGDALLAAVADRLGRQIRDSDLLARISGDEFVLLLDPVAELAVLDSLVERLRSSLAEPFDVGDANVMVSASIGVALFPEHGRDYEQLRRNADMAMYSAKSRARGNAAFFNPEIGRAAADRAGSEQSLRRAVAQRRFCGVLQPKIDLRTMSVTGFEVLARLVDGDRVLHAPAEFIDLATQLGLLDRITEIVLDDVCTYLPDLDAVFGTRTTVSVNVSTRQATDPASMAALLERLAVTGRPDRFLLEVTEDALMQSDVFGDRIRPLLRAAGVDVSIDDFGVGYASMSRLLDMTADEVKIDRSFVTAVHERHGSQVVLGALAGASSQLGIAVVAEGVETVAELDYLLRHTAIRTAQGYLFGHPMPVEGLLATADELFARLTGLAGSAGSGAVEQLPPLGRPGTERPSAA